MSEANEYEALVKRIKSKLSVVEWELLKKQSDGSWSATAEEAEMLERIKEKLTVEEWEFCQGSTVLPVGCNFFVMKAESNAVDTIKEFLGYAKAIIDLFDDADKK